MKVFATNVGQNTIKISNKMIICLQIIGAHFVKKCFSQETFHRLLLNVQIVIPSQGFNHTNNLFIKWLNLPQKLDRRLNYIFYLCLVTPISSLIVSKIRFDIFSMVLLTVGIGRYAVPACED